MAVEVPIKLPLVGAEQFILFKIGAPCGVSSDFSCFGSEALL